MNPWHLVRRFVGSVTAAPLTRAERREVNEVLTAAEQSLFARLGKADQRHALIVLRRFDALVAAAPVAARRAALLHDIGKVEVRLGTVMRVVATLVGPRGAVFRRYHAHEARGLELLGEAGSDSLTLGILRGTADAQLVAALRRADDV